MLLSNARKKFWKLNKLRNPRHRDLSFELDRCVPLTGSDVTNEQRKLNRVYIANLVGESQFWKVIPLIVVIYLSNLNELYNVNTKILDEVTDWIVGHAEPSWRLRRPKDTREGLYRCARASQFFQFVSSYAHRHLTKVIVSDSPAGRKDLCPKHMDYDSTISWFQTKVSGLICCQKISCHGLRLGIVFIVLQGYLNVYHRDEYPLYLPYMLLSGI